MSRSFIIRVSNPEDMLGTCRHKVVDALCFRRCPKTSDIFSNFSLQYETTRDEEKRSCKLYINPNLVLR